VPIPIPHGDPEGMRAYARSLRHKADAIGQVADGVHAKATEITFEGPAAEIFKQAMGNERRNAGVIVSRLDGLAAELMRAADVLQAEQEAARRHNREEAEREAAERKAAQNGAPGGPR
jgi:hypothetical protein